MADLQEQLRLIRDSAAELNGIADEAKEAVFRVESFLRDECSVGVTACIRVDGPENSIAGVYLEYRRVSGKFRIAVVTADQEGSDEEVIAWAEAPQVRKLETLKKLGELVEKIAAKVRSELLVARESVEVMKNVLDAMTDSF